MVAHLAHPKIICKYVKLFVVVNKTEFFPSNVFPYMVYKNIHGIVLFVCILLYHEL